MKHESVMPTTTSYTAQLVSSDTLRVFGYGSLLWKPNFHHTRRTVGYIKGYERRFHQRNTVHRGTIAKPARVATLVTATNEDARVWGCVYEVEDRASIEIALDQLIEREVVNGGYKFDRILFYPVTTDQVDRTQPNSDGHTGSPYEVLFHLTDPEADSFLEETSLEQQAAQIVSAYGSSGANSEYALLIAAFMRTEVPVDQAMEDDPYIFELERLLRIQLSSPNPGISSDRKSSEDSTVRDNSDPEKKNVERRRSSAREYVEKHLRRETASLQRIA